MQKERVEPSSYIFQPALYSSERLADRMFNITMAGIVINQGQGQDAIGYRPLGNTTIIAAIADGFGIRSKPDSREASRMAVEGILSYFPASAVEAAKPDRLKSAVIEIQAAVRTTLDRWGASSLTSVLLEKKDEECFASIISIGDTRCYLIDDTEISQLTQDDDIEGVSNAIGIEPSRFKVPEIYTIPLHSTNILLLTTDGFHDSIQKGETGQLGRFTAGELTKIIQQTEDPSRLMATVTEKNPKALHTDASFLLIRLG